MGGEHRDGTPSEWLAPDGAVDSIQALPPTAHERAQHDHRVLGKGHAEHRRHHQDARPVEDARVEDPAHLADPVLHGDGGAAPAQGGCPAQRHQMLPLATGLAAVRALAHLVWVATGQQRGAQALGIGRLLPWRSTLQRVPVLGNDLREDTPVPRGCRNHRMAPRWGDTIVMVQRLSHASAASSTPHLVNIRLTRFDKVGKPYRTIIAAQVIRSCALARRDVGSTPSSKRSTPHSCRLTGAMPRDLLSEIRSRS